MPSIRTFEINCAICSLSAEPHMGGDGQICAFCNAITAYVEEEAWNCVRPAIDARAAYVKDRGLASLVILCWQHGGCHPAQRMPAPTYRVLAQAVADAVRVVRERNRLHAFRARSN